MPLFPQLSEPLSDGTITVRFAAERDIPEVLIAYQDDPELHLRNGEGRPPTGAELGRRSERAESDRVAGRGLTMTILMGRDDTCRGEINVHHVDWENARAEVGIWLASGYRGAGLGRRALALVGRWLLEQSGLERVHALTDPGNEPMINAARAAGYSFEGVLRGYQRGPAGRVDVAVLSIVRRDLGT